MLLLGQRSFLRLGAAVLMLLLMILVSMQPFSLVYGQEITITIGSEVCTEGYIMDEFCITLGTLLDNDKILTLEGPDQHSVHCLVDVDVCVESPYEILEDPTTTSNGLYVRAYRVDESVDNGNGKQLLVNLARNVGICSTCNGNGNLRKGMRAAVKGTITELQNGHIPPLLHVTEVLFGSKDELCVVQQTSSPTESPTKEPIAALTSSPTETSIVVDTPSPTTMSPTETPIMVTSNPTTMTPTEMMNETMGMSNYTDVPMDMNVTDSNYTEESMGSNWTTVPTSAPNSSSNVFIPEDTTTTTDNNDPSTNSPIESSATLISFKKVVAAVAAVVVALF